MQELISLRNENSKTFDLGGGKRRLESHIGAIHYRDNYVDPNEPWLDIDLTWVGNKITRAPYELTLDGTKLTFKDKKTGEVSTIELFDIKPPGLKWEIIPENTRVHFRHILPSDKIPFEAQFKVTGKIPGTSAFDDEGALLLETSLVNNLLIEKMAAVIDKVTGKARPAKGNIRVDPTLTITTSAKDTMLLQDYPNKNYGSENYMYNCDYISGARRPIVEFDISGLPAGATLTAATLGLYYNDYTDADPVGKLVCAYKLTRTNWVEMEATWNIYKTGSNWTAAGGDYVMVGPGGGSTTFPAGGGSVWMDWSVLAIVQDAYAAGVAAEFLVKFSAENLNYPDYSTPNFRSREVPALAPRLVIDYTVPMKPSRGIADKMIAARMI